MVGDVQDQVLAHDGQADETEVTTGDDPRRSADINAGQTGATVSPWFQSTQFKIDEMSAAEGRQIRSCSQRVSLQEAYCCRLRGCRKWKEGV